MDTDPHPCDDIRGYTATSLHSVCVIRAQQGRPLTAAQADRMAAEEMTHAGREDVLAVLDYWRERG